MESKLEFPPSAILTPYNYFEWKPKIQLHLRSRGLFRITMETEVEPTSAVEKSRYFNRMDEAFGILCFSISPELLFYVESCSTPNQVWKILEELFGKQNEMLKMVEDSIAIYRNSRENFSLEPEDPHVARLYATNYVQGLQETDDGDPNQSEGTIRGTSCANVACTGNEPKKDNVAAMAASLATGSGQAQAMNPALTSMGSLNSPLQTLNPPLNPGLSSALNPAQSKPLLGAAPPLHHSGPFPAFYDQHPQPPPQHSQRLYSQSRSDYEPVTRSFKGLSGPLPSDVAAELYNVLNNLTRTKESIKGVKTWFLLLFTSVPIGLLWLNVEGVLVHLGQDTAISKVAGTYLLFLLPDLVTTSLLEPLRIYLRSQCITKPMMTCSAIAVALHVPINIFLRRLGVKGAALAICWSDFNVVLLLVAWASCLMTCLEWWSYETCVAEDGSHGTVDLGDLYAEEDRYIPPDLKLPAVKSASNLVNLISDRCFHKEPVSQQDFNSREQSFSASFSTVGCDTAVCSKLNAYDCQGGDCVYEMHTEPVEPQEIYGRSVELLLEISVERKQTVFANEFSKRSQVAGLDQAAFVLQNILVELQLFSYQVQNKLAALMMKMDMPLDLPLGEGAGTLSITTQLGTQTGRRSSHCMVDRASEFSGTLEFGPESVPVEIDSG